MGTFRTPFEIPQSGLQISLETPVLTLGSCFADCIGTYFRENKFSVLANPFGTVYNPLSIFRLSTYAIQHSYPEPDTFLFHQGLHANYDFHSSFSNPEKSKNLSDIKQAVDRTHNFLTGTKYMIITLGTAWVYRRKDNQAIVSNCHKIPGDHFRKELLSQKLILKEFEKLNHLLTDKYPTIQIILTVSPVRHIKDSIPLNQVSKSVLRLACHTLENTYPHVHYFPSYEIMMDDLRDYRFYTADMIHPSGEAESYIWDKFMETWFDAETRDFIKVWNKAKKAMAHKPFNPETKEHQKFLRETISTVKKLQHKADVTQELTFLQKQLIH